ATAQGSAFFDVSSARRFLPEDGDWRGPLITGAVREVDRRLRAEEDAPSGGMTSAARGRRLLEAWKDALTADVGLQPGSALAKALNRLPNPLEAEALAEILKRAMAAGTLQDWTDGQVVNLFRLAPPILAAAAGSRKLADILKKKILPRAAGTAPIGALLLD